jgi:hypothetical protein
MARTLAQKLGIKPGAHLLLLNAPADYATRLEPVPEGATLHTQPSGTYDFVQLFVRSRADLAEHLAIALQALKPGGLLWFAYPKKSSGVKTDITRDVGWDIVTQAGLKGVAQVAIDETWSALRFRPVEEVGT